MTKTTRPNYLNREVPRETRAARARVMMTRSGVFGTTIVDDNTLTLPRLAGIDVGGKFATVASILGVRYVVVAESAESLTVRFVEA